MASGDLSAGEKAPSSRRTLLLLLALAFVLRAGALWVTSDVEPVRDEILYESRAVALLDEHEFQGSFQSWVLHEPGPRDELPQYPGAFQPPLYIAFLAGALAVSGRDLVFAKFLQVVLGTASVLFLYRLARAWMNERRARWAAFLFAVYPTLIAFTHYLWTETLFLFLVLPSFTILTGRKLPSARGAAGAGLMLGLAALTRTSIAYFGPVLLAWFVFANRDQTGKALRLSAIVLLTGLATIAPWTIRNTAVHDGFVFVDTNGPFNLWRGNSEQTFLNREQSRVGNYAPPFDAIPISPVGNVRATRLVRLARDEHGIEHPSDLQVASTASDEAWEYIREDPAEFLHRAVLKLVDMWNPTSFLLRHFQIDGYGEDVPAGIEAAVSWAAVAAYVAVVALALVGGFGWRSDPRAWLVVLLVGYYCCVHALTFGLTRFRLPLMPFLMILGAHGLCRILDAARRAKPA